MSPAEFSKLDKILHAHPAMLFILLTTNYLIVKELDLHYARNHGSVITNPSVTNFNVAVE